VGNGIRTEGSKAPRGVRIAVVVLRVGQKWRRVFGLWLEVLEGKSSRWAEKGHSGFNPGAVVLALATNDVNDIASPASFSGRLPITMCPSAFPALSALFLTNPRLSLPRSAVAHHRPACSRPVTFGPSALATRHLRFS
jgi:hypothetical protein